MIPHTQLGNDDERVAVKGIGALDNPGNHDIPVVGQRDSVYLGEALLPVPNRLVVRIRRGDYVDMGELLPEFWAPGEESSGKRRSRKVTEILTWVRCFCTYSAVRGAHSPEMLPELMAYLSTIVRVSQEFIGLAWVRYDVGFRQQAAATRSQRWSVVNPSLYASCFTGSAKSSAPRCELCQATTHTERECAQQGDSDPDMQQRVKAMESVVLALSRQQPRRAPAGPWRPSGEVCRLFNRNSCSYPRCRHTHVCSSCGGNHPVVSCPYEGARAQPGPASGRFVTGPHHKPY